MQELEREKERLQGEVVRLVKEKAAVQERLDFVEELFGPTEAQRKIFQEQITAARTAALQAHRSGAPVPVRFLGRLDESWLRARGLSERDCALLQRGCLTGVDGVAKDVSLLGDPSFKPYGGSGDEPKWEARGGLLRLSLGDVRARWGEEVALEVVRCVIELDRHDASRRLGVELPWNEADARELEPAEVIALLERELFATRCCSAGTTDVAAATMGELSASELPSLGILEEGASNSPTWSMFDGSEDFDDSRLGTTTSSDSNSRTSTLSCRMELIPRDPHDGREETEWSLADTDIQQLLRPPVVAQARRARHKVADAPRSVLSTPREGSPDGADEESTSWSGSRGCGAAEDRDDLGEELGEVLRELLQEEVGGPLGRLLLRTPPAQPDYE